MSCYWAKFEKRESYIFRSDTQARLGQLIGVSNRVVGYMKPETLQKISNVFNVSVDYLLGTDATFVQNSVEQFGYKIVC